MWLDTYPDADLYLNTVAIYLSNAWIQLSPSRFVGMEPPGAKPSHLQN